MQIHMTLDAPIYSYKRIEAKLKRDGTIVNHKRY